MRWAIVSWGRTRSPEVELEVVPLRVGTSMGAVVWVSSRAVSLRTLSNGGR